VREVLTGGVDGVGWQVCFLASVRVGVPSRLASLGHATESPALGGVKMRTVLGSVIWFCRAWFGDRARLAFEVLAMRVVQAFPYDTAPRFLLRDRDGTYGKRFRQCMANMGIEEVLIAPRSPWQNPYAERVIGSIRRECLDHVIVLGEHHLRRIMAEYVDYYNNWRPHLSLDRNAPNPREVQPPEKGKVVAVPMVGGLHHRYVRG